MPKRVPAIDDLTLRREAGQLSDDVRLLPSQVTLLTGLSVGQLKERRRVKPPQEPFPEPREKKRKAVWYSLGAVRAYRVWLAEAAELDAELTKHGFANWLNTADLQSDPWPCAIVGPYKRPVDFWATVRGEVAMDRKDACMWLSLGEYLDQRMKSARLEAEAVDRAERVATTVNRVKRTPSGEGLAPTKIIRD